MCHVVCVSVCRRLYNNNDNNNIMIYYYSGCDVVVVVVVTGNGTHFLALRRNNRDARAVRIVYETEVRGIRGVGAGLKCACVCHQKISCASVLPAKIQ